MHAKDVKWPWTHNDQRTLYTGIVNTYPCGPNIGHFRSTSSRFRGTRLSKIGIMLNDLRKTTNTLLWKVPCAHYINTYPLGPKFRSVLLCDQPFLRHKDVENRKKKKEMQRLISDCRWTHNGECTLHACTRHLPMGPKFWSVLLYSQPFSFERCPLKLSIPFDPMLTKKSGKN